LIQGGHATAVAIINLMQQTFKAIAPERILNDNDAIIGHCLLHDQIRLPHRRSKYSHRATMINARGSMPFMDDYTPHVCGRVIQSSGPVYIKTSFLFLGGRVLL
jgi:hypothetical protein